MANAYTAHVFQDEIIPLKKYAQTETHDLFKHLSCFFFKTILPSSMSHNAWAMDAHTVTAYTLPTL